MIRSTNGSRSTPNEASVGGGIRNGNKVMVLGNSIAFYATNFYGTNRGTRSESQNAAMALNDVRYPSYMDLENFVPKRLTVTTAGTTGDREPEWPAIGETVQDGTVTWTVSADTAGYTGLPGYFNVANALMGYALNPIFVVGAKSRRWEYIKQIADRALDGGVDPDIVWLLAPLENDVASFNAYTEVDSVWASFNEFIDRQINAGRRVIVQGIHPASTYTATGISCAGALDMRTEAWARRNSPQAYFWHAPRDLYLSKVSGANWTPDVATSYFFSSGGQATATDGIHPNGAVHVRLGIDAAEKVGGFLGIPRKGFRDYTTNGPQRFADPRALTTGGTLGTGVTGAVPPGDWSTQGTGSASGFVSLLPRTDGVMGNFIVVEASGANNENVTCQWKATKTLATLGLAVGDEIEVFVEIGGWDLSDLACIPTVDLTLVGATGHPQSISAMRFSGFANQMQGQILKARNDLMTYRINPWRLKIPTGCTGLFLAIKLTGLSGAWTGKLVIGRINIEKVA